MDQDLALVGSYGSAMSSSLNNSCSDKKTLFVKTLSFRINHIFVESIQPQLLKHAAVALAI